MTTTPASTVSALIIPPSVGVFLAPQNEASPHVGEHCAEKENGDYEIEQVYHGFLVDAIRAIHSAPNALGHMIENEVLRPHKERAADHQDFTKIRSGSDLVWRYRLVPQGGAARTQTHRRNGR